MPATPTSQPLVLPLEKVNSMNMRRPLFSRMALRVPLLILLLTFFLFASAVGAQDEEPAGLRPGQTTIYQQNVPINLVFIGYERNEIDVAAMKAELPASSHPIVRYPPFYGLVGREMGLNFKFNYVTTFAGAGFEDDFFDYIYGIGEPGELTYYQQLYNDQQNNVRDLSGPNLTVSAEDTEKWLLDNAGRLGIDPNKSYTVFLIDGYGRADFQPHVYNKSDEPDPDTGINFGDFPFAQMIAWGGSHGRAFFHDLSAGPEWNTDNWNVDQPDLNGDGVEEYRMPPTWEYTAAGYRDPSALGPDLGKAVRWVAINLLFFPSPLYDPLVSAPGVDAAGAGGDKVIHVEMLEHDRVKRFRGLDIHDTAFALERFQALEPYHNWQVIEEETKEPIPSGAARSLRIFAGLLRTTDCWNQYGTTFAQLFCYFDANYDRYVPAYDPEDHVAALFAYNTTSPRMGNQFGLGGFADDDWQTGTPRHTFLFHTPDYGVGFTFLTVHESGHHVGLSHPHDGYDPATGIDYGPGGPLYFAWLGDESDTVMSYLNLSQGFGQFNADSMHRYEFAGYLNWSNQLLAAIQSDPGAGSVRGLVNESKDAALKAERAFRNWDFLAAATHARTAYERMATAAAQLGVSAALPAIEVPAGFTPLTGNHPTPEIPRPKPLD